MNTPVDSKSEAFDYSLKQVNDNQAQINYVLNHVDIKLIEALKPIIDFLKKVKDVPAISRELKDVDFTKIDAAISAAEKHTGIVASIKPPGCEPPVYPLG